MDVLRGVAIVLIVQQHATALLGANGVAPSSILALGDMLLAPFRIPLLLVLSGMLVPSGIAKGAGAFVASRARTILWPLVVWSLLLALAYPWLRWDSVAAVPTGPTTYLWYLHALLVCSLVALLVRRVPWWASALVAYGVAIAAHVMDDTEWLDTAALERWSLLLAYLLTGAALRMGLRHIAPIVQRWPVFATLLAIGAGVVLLSYSGVRVVRYDDALVAPLVLASVLGAMGLAMRLPLRGPGVPLAAIGRRSVVTYVLHWVVLDAAIPAVAYAVGDGLPAVTQLVTVVVALVVCAGVAALADRTRAVRILFRL